MQDSEWEDYTNASEWEQLQHSVEQVLISWGLRNKGVVTHLDDDDDDDDEDDDNDNDNIDNDNSGNDTTNKGAASASSSGTMEGIQGGTIRWRSREISTGSSLNTQHHRLPPATYRLTLYYGNVKAGLPRWSPGQEHLTPTMLSMLDTRQDFQLGRPFVHRIFGLSHFLLFCDVNDDTRPPNQLLSVVTVALNQVDCTLPVFVPVQERMRKYYVGLSVPGSRGAITIRYESDERPSNPNPMLTTLSGLSEFLRRKVRRSLQQQQQHQETTLYSTGTLQTTTMAHQQHPQQYRQQQQTTQQHLQTLTITHAVRWIWTGRTRREHDDEWRRPFYCHSHPFSELDLLLGRKKELQEEQQEENEEYYHHVMDRGVWGPCCDPVAQLWIFATWPKFPEGAFVESEEYSSLNSDQAPEWYVRCHPSKHIAPLEEEEEEEEEEEGDKAENEQRKGMYGEQNNNAHNSMYVPWTALLSCTLSAWKETTAVSMEEDTASSTGIGDGGTNTPWTYMQWEECQEHENFVTAERTWGSGSDGGSDGSGSDGSGSGSGDRRIAENVRGRMRVWMHSEQEREQQSRHSDSSDRRRRRQRTKRSEIIASAEELSILLEQIFTPLDQTITNQDSHDSHDSHDNQHYTATLSSYLSLQLATLCRDHHGVSSLSALWCGFVEEVSWRCHHGIPLPRMRTADDTSSNTNIKSVDPHSAKHMTLDTLLTTIQHLLQQPQESQQRNASNNPSPSPPQQEIITTTTTTTTTTVATMRAYLLEVADYTKESFHGMEKSVLENMYLQCSKSALCKSVVQTQVEWCLDVLREHTTLQSLLHTTMMGVLSLTPYVFQKMVPKTVWLKSDTLRQRHGIMARTIRTITTKERKATETNTSKTITSGEVNRRNMVSLLHAVSMCERTVSYCCSLVHKFNGYGSLTDALLKAEYGAIEDDATDIDTEETSQETSQENSRHEEDGGDNFENDDERRKRWEQNKVRNDGAIFLKDENSRVCARHAMSIVKCTVRSSAPATAQLNVPDVKEYIVRCVASSPTAPTLSVTEMNAPNERKRTENLDVPYFSTCHRMYVMLETKTRHIRFACALSESE
jgi:hypothetical protein